MKQQTHSRYTRSGRHRARIAAPTALALLAGLALTEGTAHAVAARASVSGPGITVSVNADGSYTIATT